jgi:methionyl-tRNA formyltransferase
MRVGFAGTPAFAALALTSVLDAGFDVPLVLTRPDRPSGRGLALKASPVKDVALARSVPVLQPPSLNPPEARAEVLAVPLDVLVVAAYGLILPDAVLAWPRHGCINIHASLLPRWRGAAPIQRAILAGDAQTGVTIMQMDAGLDTGPMLERVPVTIDPRETARTLHDRLAAAGAVAIVEVLQRLQRGGTLPCTPQPEDGVTYANKIANEEAAIDWTRDAQEIDRTIRAFDPSPGAFTRLDAQVWKLWRAHPIDRAADAAPGTIVRAGGDAIDVACGVGGLRVSELQPAGGKRLAASAVLAGRRLQPGQRFAGRG